MQLQIVSLLFFYITYSSENVDCLGLNSTHISNVYSMVHCLKNNTTPCHKVANVFWPSKQLCK